MFLFDTDIWLNLQKHLYGVKPMHFKEYYTEGENLFKVRGEVTGYLVTHSLFSRLYLNTPSGDWEYILKKAVEWAKDMGVFEVRSSPLSRWEFEPSKVGFTHTHESSCTRIIDLTKPEEEILKGTDKKFRWGLRKAEKSGVFVTLDEINASDAFYALHSATLDRADLEAMPKEEFDYMVLYLKKHGLVNFFFARFGDKLLNAAMIISYNGMGFWMFGGSSMFFRNLCAGNKLQWEIMKELKRRGMIQYDVGGIIYRPEKGTKYEAIERFKSSMGGEVVFFKQASAITNKIGYATWKILTREKEIVHNVQEN